MNDVFFDATRSGHGRFIVSVSDGKFHAFSKEKFAVARLRSVDQSAGFKGFWRLKELKK